MKNFHLQVPAGSWLYKLRYVIRILNISLPWQSSISTERCVNKHALCVSGSVDPLYIAALRTGQLWNIKRYDCINRNPGQKATIDKRSWDKRPQKCHFFAEQMPNRSLKMVGLEVFSGI